jgi:uncharacterized protein
VATALITGASSGLGAEFARQLARENYRLLLVARRRDRLEQVAGEAKTLGAPDARVIAHDLAAPGAAEALWRQIADDGTTVEYLVNNAGFGAAGSFKRSELKREIDQIGLNVAALVALTRLALPAMVERGHGTIINVASTAAFQPTPFMATYGATKAFVLSFSEALAEELRGSGVTVTALCPGLTRTEFQRVAQVDESIFPAFACMDASTVVAQGIAAAKRGQTVEINGMTNSLMVYAQRLMPRALVRRIAGALFHYRGADAPGGDQPQGPPAPGEEKAGE